jgi:nitric oxide reductase subunit B
LHVSTVIMWILLGATGAVYSCLHFFSPVKPSVFLARTQLALWVIAFLGIVASYLLLDFGGREYWEFNPVWALPVAVAWLLFIINFTRVVRKIRSWPVYVWMWMTGIVFFLFTFIENYLWMFPFFRDRIITDLTIQWKVNGSMVGAWNQMIYGTAFFLMERISNSKDLRFNKLAFAMYFLGLFNLMFNWGHHIYTLPTAAYVRYIGYAVSMTEWILFIRIVYNWNKSVSMSRKHIHYFPYRFILAADIWVFLNMGQALLMSIPAINIYTHGTHVTVAHAMGTTIGINSMILLAACFEFFSGECLDPNRIGKKVKFFFWSVQGSLLVFWISLNIAGIQRGIWQMSAERIPFTQMMSGLNIWFVLFIVAGFGLLISMGAIAYVLLRSYAKCYFKKKVSLEKEMIETSISFKFNS